MSDRLSIEAEGEAVAARHYRSSLDPFRARLILAHGAGAPQTSPFMVSFAAGLASRGLDVVTFDFPYMGAGRRVPDPGPRLERCYRAVLGWAGQHGLGGRPLLIGGKSLGGRIASQVAASDGLAVAPDGVVCLGYPLHPPGRPDRLRVEHLTRLRVPVFIAQGSRDPFGRPEEIREAFASAGALLTLFVIEGGDHSFKVPKSTAAGSGRRQSPGSREGTAVTGGERHVHDQVMDGVVEWTQGLRSRAPQ